MTMSVDGESLASVCGCARAWWLCTVRRFTPGDKDAAALYRHCSRGQGLNGSTEVLGPREQSSMAMANTHAREEYYRWWRRNTAASQHHSLLYLQTKFTIGMINRRCIPLKRHTCATGKPRTNRKVMPSRLPSLKGQKKLRRRTSRWAHTSTCDSTLE